MRTPAIISLMVLSILYGSCVLDKEAKEETYADILVKGKWHLAHIGFSLPTGDSINNIDAQLEPCELDDYEMFIVHGNWLTYSNYIISCFGQQKCHPAEPECGNSTGVSWSINEQQDTLTMGGLKYTFARIDKDEMKLLLAGAGHHKFLTYTNLP